MQVVKTPTYPVVLISTRLLHVILQLYGQKMDLLYIACRAKNCTASGIVETNINVNLYWCYKL